MNRLMLVLALLAAALTVSALAAPGGKADGDDARGFSPDSTSAMTTARTTKAARLAAFARSSRSATSAQGSGWPSILRLRHLDIRRYRLQARRVQVALPDRRVSAEVEVGQDRPQEPAYSSRDEAMEQPLPWPRCRRARLRQDDVRACRCRRARVRSAEERVRTSTVAGARSRARGAPCRPRDARPTQSGACSGADSPARGLGRSRNSKTIHTMSAIKTADLSTPSGLSNRPIEKQTFNSSRITSTNSSKTGRSSRVGG